MPGVASKPCSAAGCSCICGECPGCQCECHYVDHVPNPILKKVLNEQGVSFNELANMSRNQLFHKMMEEDEPCQLLLNALNIYNVRKNHYGVHEHTNDADDESDDAILRRIARNTVSKPKRKKTEGASAARKAARKSSKSKATRKSDDQCES